MWVCTNLLQLYLTLCDPMDIALQVPLSMGFFRQEYRSGLPCLPPGDRPNPGALMSPALAGSFFTTCTTCQAPSSFILQRKKLNYKGFRAYILPPLSLS